MSSAPRTPRTPRSGGGLAAQLSQISHTKMVATTNAKPTSAQLNQLMAENSSLKSRLSSTIEDLRDARDIYEKQHGKWRQQYERMKEELGKRSANAAQYEALQRQHQSALYHGGHSSISRARSNSPRARLASQNLYQLDKERGGGDDGSNPAMQWVIAMPPWNPSVGLSTTREGSPSALSPFGRRNDNDNNTINHNNNYTNAAGDGMLLDSNNNDSFFADRGARSRRRMADADVQTDLSRRNSPSRLSAAGGGGANADAPLSQSDHIARDAELRLLNAELLKLQSENITLKGSVEMLRRDVASDASGRIVRRYEEMASQQIKALSRALEGANAALTAKERELMAVTNGGGNGLGKGTSGRRSPSNATTNSIRPSTAGVMQQMLLKQAREKARSIRGGSVGPAGGGGIIGNFLGGNRGGGMAPVPTVSVGVGTDQPWVEAPPAGPYYAHDDKGKFVVPSYGGEGTDGMNNDSGAAAVVSSFGDGDAATTNSSSIALRSPRPTNSATVAVADAAQPHAVAALQHSLEVTKAQLKQALEELAMGRAAAPLGQTLTTVRTRTNNVGTQVSEQSAIERVFLIFHEEFSAANAERILSERQNKAQGALLALTEVANYNPSNDGTKLTLQTTRSELLAAHEHIEELEFALELERREKQRALDYATGGSVSPARDVNGDPITQHGEAARQASHEIAFLCDTLAATKMENEMLHEKLQASERERVDAMQCLAALRKKSSEIVRGCHQVAEESRVDAEAAMINLLGQVHQKQSEASQLRGLLGQAKRGNEDLQSRLEETEKELILNKTKLFNLRDSTAKLREDYNLVTVQLRQAKIRLNMSPSSPVGGGANSPNANGGLGGGGASSPFRQLMINSSCNASITATGRDRTQSLVRNNNTNNTNTNVAHHEGGGSGFDSPRDSLGPSTPRAGMTGVGGIRIGSPMSQHEVSALEMLAGEDGVVGHGASSSGEGGSPGGSVGGGGPRARFAPSPTGSPLNNNSFGSTSAASNGPARRRAYSEYSRNPRMGGVGGGAGGGGGALITVDHTQLISENDCRLLLETLMPYAPGAITPNQIVEGVLASAELLNDRISELESELKTKSGYLTAAKKDVALLQQRIRKLEVDRETAISKSQKPTMKDKKELFAATQSQQILREELRNVTSQLDATRARLEEAQIEIDEGKELMMRLIKE